MIRWLRCAWQMYNYLRKFMISLLLRLLHITADILVLVFSPLVSHQVNDGAV